MSISLAPLMRQQLAMTPEFQRSIAMLQLSGVEFEQAVEEALVTNPFLEREDVSDDFRSDFRESLRESSSDSSSDSRSESLSESLSQTTTASVEASAEEAQQERTQDKLSDGSDDFDRDAGVNDWGAGGFRDLDDDTDSGSYTARPEALSDELLLQVRVSRLDGRDRELAMLMVSALDSDGYLRQSFDELRGLVTPVASDEELDLALRLIQSFEPTGVGARTMVECLMLQLGRSHSTHPHVDLARRMLTLELEATSAHDLSRLKRVFSCGDAALREAYCLIRACNPRPGNRFGADETRYVVADVIIRKKACRWIASINPQVMPRLHLNDAYAKILQSKRGSAASPMGQQLQEARWFMRNVQQRFQTIQRVAQAIVDRQNGFFDYGEVAMRPLVLRDVAQELGLHESTVSRVTSNKYASTPCGLLELKKFFCSHVESKGNACSSTAVRALIKTIIEHELRDQPLSDIKVTKMLERKGVHVARRTVSKYRDSMQIPPVEARRMAMRA